jgi:hypothetical protein
LHLVISVFAIFKASPNPPTMREISSAPMLADALFFSKNPECR